MESVNKQQIPFLKRMLLLFVVEISRVIVSHVGDVWFCVRYPAKLLMCTLLLQTDFIIHVRLFTCFMLICTCKNV